MTEMTDQPADQNTDNLIRAAAFDLGYLLGQIEGKLTALLTYFDRVVPSNDTDTDQKETRQ